MNSIWSVNYNDGRPIEDSVIDAIGEMLLAQFNGVTMFPQRNEGPLENGIGIFHDHIVIFWVLTEDIRRADFSGTSRRS